MHRDLHRVEATLYTFGPDYSRLSTARSVEDDTRNDRRNANRNPEW